MEVNLNHNEPVFIKIHIIILFLANLYFLFEGIYSFVYNIVKTIVKRDYLCQ